MPRLSGVSLANVLEFLHFVDEEDEAFPYSPSQIAASLQTQRQTPAPDVTKVPGHADLQFFGTLVSDR